MNYLPNGIKRQYPVHHQIKINGEEKKVKIPAGKCPVRLTFLP
jgi:hypothetical protein